MKHILGYGVAILVITGAVVWGIRAEISVARAEEKAKALEHDVQVSKDAEKRIEEARKHFDDALEAERKKPATIKTVEKFIPVPLPPGSEVKVEKPPDAPPQIVLTGDVQKNLDFIQNLEIKHLQCDKNLEACKGVDAEKDKQIQALTDKAKTWEQTAKGGSKLHRFGKALKVVGCAAGGAGLGALLGKTRGAAIGGAAGAGACQIFW